MDEAYYQSVLDSLNGVIAQVNSYLSLTRYEMAQWLKAKRDVITNAHDQHLVDTNTCSAALAAIQQFAVKDFLGDGDPTQSPVYQEAKAQGKDAALGVAEGGLAGALPQVFKKAVEDALPGIPWYVWAGGAAVVVVLGVVVVRELRR